MRCPLSCFVVVGFLLILLEVIGRWSKKENVQIPDHRCQLTFGEDGEDEFQDHRGLLMARFENATHPSHPVRIVVSASSRVTTDGLMTCVARFFRIFSFFDEKKKKEE